jgi:hypothetical protein
MNLEHPKALEVLADPHLKLFQRIGELGVVGESPPGADSARELIMRFIQVLEAALALTPEAGMLEPGTRLRHRLRGQFDLPARHVGTDKQDRQLELRIFIFNSELRSYSPSINARWYNGDGYSPYYEYINPRMLSSTSGAYKPMAGRILNLVSQSVEVYANAAPPNGL